MQGYAAGARKVWMKSSEENDGRDPEQETTTGGERSRTNDDKIAPRFSGTKDKLAE